MQIKAQDLSFSVRDVLFRDLSFSFGEGDRIGVVGNNGAGKTTLLRCIAGTLQPTAGSVVRPRGCRLMFVEQTTPAEMMGLSLKSSILTGLPPDEYDSSDWRADLALDVFEAPEDLRLRPLSELSGGWLRLAMIARAWVSEPDALVLDEPTNHLDLTKILLLENWLNTELKKLPLLLVSHDRRFLDNCTNRTLFLRPSVSKLYSHPFSRARELLLADDQALESRKAKETMEMQRLRKSAHALREIGVNNYSSAALRKSIQIANRADSIQETMTETHVEAKRDIKLSSRDTHLKRLVSIENLAITSPSGVILFTIRALHILRGQRVVLLGKNGTGKTQFVRHLREVFDGTVLRDQIRLGPALVLGYFDQALSQLPSEAALKSFVAELLESGSQRTTSTLVTAGFPLQQHDARIGDLSPGEKARLALLALRIQEPSFYLMDEPTNHLDITGQEQLENEVLEHEATAVLVSHDRAFVEHTGTRFLVIESGSLFEIESPAAFYRSLETKQHLGTWVDNLEPL